MKKIILLSVLSLMLAACSDDKPKNEPAAEPEVEVKEDKTPETEIMYTILDSFSGEEKSTNYDKVLIEETVNYGPGVEIKPGGEMSVAPEGTNFLTLSVRANENEDDDVFAADVNQKTVTILNAIQPLMDKNNISTVQFNWNTPSKTNDQLESANYILRFFLNELKLDEINENNIVEFADYVAEDYKEL